MVVIDSKPVSISGYIKDVINHSGLIWSFIRRDFILQYRSSKIGFLWAVIYPLIYLFLISYGLKAIKGGNQTEHLTTLIPGIVFWVFFSQSISQSASILRQSSNLISKIYFPRLTIVIALVFNRFIDFLIALLIGTIYLFIKTNHFNIESVFWFIFFITLSFLITLICSVLCSLLGYYSKDFRLGLPFLIQLGLFVSPVLIGTQLQNGQIFNKSLLWGLIHPLNYVIQSGINFGLESQINLIEHLSKYYLVILYLIGVLLISLFTFKMFDKKLVDYA
jgi:ABC-type polysaccharide/polyol phosphate export permease